MRIFLVLLLATAAAAAGWYFGNRAKRSSSAAVAPARDSAGESVVSNDIHGIGKLEPKSGIVKIFAPAGQRIDSICGLKIGDSVEIDQPLFVLSGREQRQIELQMARARKTDAMNQLEFEQEQGRIKKQSAQLALEEARSASQKIASKRKSIVLLEDQIAAATDQLERLQSLRGSQLTRRLVGESDIAKQRLLVSQLQTQRDQANDEVELAIQQADRAEQAAEVDLKTVDFMISESDRSVPTASLNRSVVAARKAFEMTEIKSPIKGRVLDIVVRPGDTATNQPVMLLGNTDEMVCIAEINDINLNQIQQGAAAKIESLAFEETISGTVISRGIMIGPPSMKDPNPFASVDRKTGRVVIELDRSSPAEDFVNLQVEVKIEPGRASDPGSAEIKSAVDGPVQVGMTN